MCLVTSVFAAPTQPQEISRKDIEYDTGHCHSVEAAHRRKPSYRKKQKNDDDYAAPGGYRRSVDAAKDDDDYDAPGGYRRSV
ncbi:hypothetical protein HIM_11926 [Hirsutella minnesotensis 3608]|uniref:Uncharacterized protein n=1 Tax=Hirsutella minnesotensis 3608 TaxID=1043627 RepID=A0A0F7ZQY7_9HYPO|nr:hypothetical protein HIM_12351 [Hirsutella minnesotensis 3608]KJZ68683.1 hypothetical protein HIM_11926 [Hirsutella minnesotensis 3608]